MPGSYESADLGVRQPLGRTVGVLALCIVVQDEHCEPLAVAGLRVLQHLPVTDRVTERGIGPASDHEVDALWLAGVVVVQEQLRLLGEKGLALLIVAILRAAGGADHLLGRNCRIAINRLRPNLSRERFAQGYARD